MGVYNWLRSVGLQDQLQITKSFEYLRHDALIKKFSAYGPIRKLLDAHIMEVQKFSFSFFLYFYFYFCGFVSGMEGEKNIKSK
jgi:hypothetical protein